MPVTAIAPPVESIDALVSGLSSYLNRDQINGIRRAYYYAEQAHEGQFRRSGEPYVTHPLAVAGILCEMHMDPQSLMAAMLHDVIEDTGITKTAIKTQFGNSVAELVDGVSKLNKMTFSHILIPTADPKQHGTGQSGERRRVRYKKCKRD